MGLGTGCQLSSDENQQKIKRQGLKSQKEQQKKHYWRRGQTLVHGFGNWLVAFRRHQKNQKDIKIKKTRRPNKQIILYTQVSLEWRDGGQTTLHGFGDKSTKPKR